MDGTQTLNEAYSQTGYSRKQVIGSIVLATVLHVVVLGAYFILGSSKKAPQPAVAAKTEGDGAKPATGTPPKDGKSADPGAKPSTAHGDEKPGKVPDEIKKSTEVAKPNEIPSKPDTDIDDIFKRK